MATKKFLELQEFNDADLLTELEETQKQYTKLNFDHSVQGLENPLRLREVRRDIARLKSEIRRREVKNLSEEQLAKRSRIRNRRAK